MHLPSVHPAALPVDQLAAQCEIRFTRRSGPGGQHRNKVETAVVVRHRPTDTEAEAAERRSQAENRHNALFRLRLKLALSVRLPVDPDAEPSECWQARCRGGRLAINPLHDDFPALLAEALDRLAVCHDEPGVAGGWLGCSASQLVKLLKLEPRAMLALNQRRERRGHRRLL